MVYNILEIANTHGGSVSYLKTIIKDFSVFKGDFGFKFQIFKPELIALKDFSYYDIYKTLYIEESDWNQIISIVKKNKMDVWLDMFDLYSVEILKQNLINVSGIKLQASVLHNTELLTMLSSLDLTSLKVIINIAGYDMVSIEKLLLNIENLIKPQEVIIQIGFQNYPTDLNDAGLSKISFLKNNFSKQKICFADHTEGNLDSAILMPLIAYSMGCSYIEKHIYCSQLKTEYDKVSSLDLETYSKYIKQLGEIQSAIKEPFLNEREKQYLDKTLQIPIANKELEKGTSISFNKDLKFQRTDEHGLNTNELKVIIEDFQVLNIGKKKDSTFQKVNFRKAKIGAIVACRMKSRRLPKKATLKIGALSSIELCLKNVLQLNNIEHTILATSTLDEDLMLKDYTYSKDVIFHRGDPDDVVERFLGIAEQLQLDIIIRLTGDNPFISNEVSEILLKSHFETGADYTSATNACIGTNTEIFNISTLRRIKSHFPNANFSEYMTYYVTNNPSYFNINHIELPVDLARDYRLTLDYEEDLKLFNNIVTYLDKSKFEFSLKSIFEYLDSHPEISKINKYAVVKYMADPKLIDQINEATTIGNSEMNNT